MKIQGTIRKKNAAVFFSLLVTISVTAQEVVTTQGDSYSNSSGSIDFTVGETVSNTGTNGTNEITQGFQQSNWTLLGLENHSPQYVASMFPNPTEDVLNIRTTEFEDVTFTLYDSQGKILLQDVLSAEQTPIEVHQLAPGNYSVMLTKESQKLKAFKLVKTN